MNYLRYVGHGSNNIRYLKKIADPDNDPFRKFENLIKFEERITNWIRHFFERL